MSKGIIVFCAPTYGPQRSETPFAWLYFEKFLWVCTILDIFPGAILSYGGIEPGDKIFSYASRHII